MRVRLKAQFTDFQRLVVGICEEYRRRGMDSRDATTLATVRMVSITPELRRLKDKAGWQYEWPVSDQERVAELVRQNLWFREKNVYVFLGTGDLEIEMRRAPCPHGRDFYCAECWEEAASRAASS